MSTDLMLCLLNDLLVLINQFLDLFLILELVVLEITVAEQVYSPKPRKEIRSVY